MQFHCSFKMFISSWWTEPYNLWEFACRKKLLYQTWRSKAKAYLLCILHVWQLLRGNCLKCLCIKHLGKQNSRYNWPLQRKLYISFRYVYLSVISISDIYLYLPWDVWVSLRISTQDVLHHTFITEQNSTQLQLLLIYLEKNIINASKYFPLFAGISVLSQYVDSLHGNKIHSTS